MDRAGIRFLGWLLVALTLGVCFAASWAISLRITLPERDGFNALGWELRHAPGKWLYLTGRLIDGGLSREEEDERLVRYLVLTAEVRRLSSEGAPEAEIDRLRAGRDRLENDVEAIIEGRLTGVIEDAGLASSLPVVPVELVFPPVDVEFDQPPSVLMVSRRDRIEQVWRRPLQPGLPLQVALDLERRAEEGGERSALVVTIAGAATYPSIVAPQADYERLVETVAHEWVHQYLFFKPLGRRIFDSVELRTLNETVATIAAQDLAALYLERHPLPREWEARLAGDDSEDALEMLTGLRLEVEELLDAGRIDEAEALMEARRQELAEQGIVYRRINQAFFAFRGAYAHSPGSIDPIGGKLATVRERAGSVAAFLDAVDGLTSAAQLDRLLAARATP